MALPPPVTPLAKPSAAPVTAATVWARAARADVKRMEDLMVARRGGECGLKIERLKMERKGIKEC